MSGQASCSFCSSLGVPCRVTKRATGSSTTSTAFRSGKHKKGKIIRELLADAAQDTTQDEDNLSQTEQGEAVTNLLAPFDGGAMQITSNFRKTEPPPTSNIDPLILGSASASTLARSRSSFLNVPGLTVNALEDCFEGYFNSLNLWMPLTEGIEAFMTRYSLFLSDVQGTERAHGEKITYSTLPPMSELLVLAVASRGSAFTTSYKHLERPLYDRGAALARDPHYQGLNDLDGIEAINLLAERFARPLRAVPDGGQHPSSTVLDPLGKGFAAELCVSLKLNEEAPPFSGEYHRRARLFWTIFCHDALRSASACRMYRLHDEDVGWPLRINFSNQPIVALAMIARMLCRSILSSRARCLGIEAAEVHTLLDKLSDWPDLVKIPLDTVDYKDKPGTPASQYTQATGFAFNETPPGDLDPQNQHRLLVKRCTAIGFWLRLTLSIWTFLNEIGYLATSEIMLRVEQETARAAIRMVKLAKVCVKARLVDYGPNALLTTSAAWVLYFIRKISDLRKADDGSATHDKKAELLGMAQVLLEAVRSAKTRPESESLALRLEAMLQKADSVPLADITKLAESSTADLQIPAYTREEVILIKRGKKRDRTRDTQDLPQPVQHPRQRDNDNQQALTPGEIMHRDFISRNANYLQQQEQGIIEPSLFLASPHTHAGAFSQTQAGISSSANTFTSPDDGASLSTQSILDNANATQSLAAGFPTGIGEFGDEDYLNLMASCGFDMPFTSLQAGVDPM